MPGVRSKLNFAIIILIKRKDPWLADVQQNVHLTFVVVFIFLAAC